MAGRQTSALLAGRAFLEAPRWRDGGLFVSAMYEDAVLRVDLGGNAAEVAAVPVPSGLGWRPDGTMLIVSMEARLVYGLRAGALSVAADLSAVAPAQINDMVVDTSGRAYVTQLGSDLIRGAALEPAPILRVEADGVVGVERELLRNGNGVLLSPDGSQLVVAEHRGGRLTAFRVETDGSLSGRRLFAEVPGEPDGICLDAAGCVWCGLGTGDRFVRVRDGGEIVEEVATPGRHAIAAALGGEDGRLLFLLTAETVGRAAHLRGLTARVEVCEVAVPGVGRPWQPGVGRP